MYTWNQYKRLNENRNLNENMVQKKYQIYLGKLELEEFLRNPIGGSSLPYLLQEDGFYLLQEDGSKVYL
jgi:hypothetical protein